MLCDKCKQRPATVHFTKIINNEKYEQHLCEECSKGIPHFSFSIDPSFSLNKILANLLTNDPTFSGMGLAFKSERCENCGLTYSQFAQGGKLGCSNCYEVFKDKLNPLESVNLPSSSTCKRILKTSGWAFSISSNKITVYGFLRTASVS
jgi:protein arginine kinase activator